MITLEARRRMKSMWVLLVPVAMIFVTSTLLDAPGPQRVEGMQTAMNPVRSESETGDNARPWSDDEQELADYIRALRSRSFDQPPFRSPAEPLAPDPDPAPIDEAETEPVLNVEIGGIMSAGDRAVVLIDGRPHRMGDHVSDEQWVVLDIDSTAEEITFRHRDTGLVKVKSIPRAAGDP